MSSIPFTDLAASRYSKIRISSMTNLMHNRIWTPSGHEVSLRLQRGRSLQRCQPVRRESNFGEPSSPLTQITERFPPSSDILHNGQVSKATCIVSRVITLYCPSQPVYKMGTTHRVTHFTGSSSEGTKAVRARSARSSGPTRGL